MQAIDRGPYPGKVAQPCELSFYDATRLAAYARGNKTLLKDLFGGQGIQRLARVVAWCHREQTGRRAPAEVLCYFADLSRNGGITMEEPILAERWTSFDDILRACLLDAAVAAIMLRPMTAAGAGLCRARLADRAELEPDFMRFGRLLDHTKME